MLGPSESGDCSTLSFLEKGPSERQCCFKLVLSREKKTVSRMRLISAFNTTFSFTKNFKRMLAKTSFLCDDGVATQSSANFEHRLVPAMCNRVRNSHFHGKLASAVDACACQCVPVRAQHITQHAPGGGQERQRERVRTFAEIRQRTTIPLRPQHHKGWIPQKASKTPLKSGFFRREKGKTNAKIGPPLGTLLFVLLFLRERERQKTCTTSVQEKKKPRHLHGITRCSPPSQAKSVPPGTRRSTKEQPLDRRGNDKQRLPGESPRPMPHRCGDQLGPSDVR